MCARSGECAARRSVGVTAGQLVRYLRVAPEEPSSPGAHGRTPNPAAARGPQLLAGRGGGPNVGTGNSVLGVKSLEHWERCHSGRVNSHPNPTADLVGAMERF